MTWLQSIFNGGSAGLTLVLIVLGLAIALVLLFWIFRKIAGDNALKPGRNRQPRLSVTDAAIVDDKRRLVLVRRDNIEHLLMIGGPTDIVVEQNIVRTHPGQVPQPAQPAPQAEAAGRRVDTREAPRPSRAESRPAADQRPARRAAAETQPVQPGAPEPKPETDEAERQPAARLARLRGEAAVLVGSTHRAAPEEVSPPPRSPTAPVTSGDVHEREPEIETSAPAEDEERYEPRATSPEVETPRRASAATDDLADEIAPPIAADHGRGTVHAEEPKSKRDSMEEEMQRLLDELAGPKRQ